MTKDETLNATYSKIIRRSNNLDVQSKPLSHYTFSQTCHSNTNNDVSYNIHVILYLRILKSQYTLYRKNDEPDSV